MMLGLLEVNYVPKLCTKIMYQNYVPKLCTKIMYQNGLENMNIRKNGTLH